MKYSIDFNKIVCELMPHYIGGRKLLLFLQACVHPLKTINEGFISYAKEALIEYTMTSQIIKLEWFLNRKFSKLFEKSTDSIQIGDKNEYGLPIVKESSPSASTSSTYIYKEDEKNNSDLILYSIDIDENKGFNTSFKVYIPKLKENAPDIESELKKWVDRYKLTNKTYIIVFEK